MNINPQVTLDPILIMAFKHIFDWANNEGLAGRRVSHLEIKEPTTNDMFDPLSQHIRVLCQLWLNEEQFEAVKDKYKKSWSAYCEDMGISPDKIHEYIDKSAEERKKNHEP